MEKRLLQTQVVLFFGVCILGLPLLNWGWAGDESLHSVLEGMAFTVALAVGGLAVVRFQAQRGVQYLFFGVGFLGAALFDGIHFLITSPWLSAAAASSLQELTPWSWLLSRTYLGVLMVMAAITSRGEEAEGRRVGSWFVVATVAALAVGCAVVFVLAPLPQVAYSDWIIPRPLEVVPGALFLLAFFIFARTGAWRQDRFHQWLQISLLAHAWVQLGLMPWSHVLYDAPFNWAHVAKIGAYFLVLVGLAHSFSDMVYAQASLADELQQNYDRLQEESARRELAQASLRIYEDIVRNMTAGLAVLELEDFQDLGSFRFLLTNQAVEPLIGKPTSLLLGRTIGECLPAALESEVPSLYRRVLETQEPIGVDDLYFSGDGIEGYFRLWVFPLSQRTVGVMFDNITAQKQAELELEESRNKLAEAQRLARLGSWEWHIPADRVAWSDELYRIFGYEPGEIQISLATFLDHVHPADREFVQAHLENTLRSGAPLNYYFRARTRAGEELIIHGLGAIDYDEEGQPLRLRGTAQDVTEAQRVQRKLEASQARLAQAHALARLGHWDWDLITNEVEISPQLAIVFGLREDETHITFADFLALIHPDDRSEVERSIFASIEQERTFTVQFRIKRPDGEQRVIQGIGEVAAKEDGRPVLISGTGQDVTERYRMEQKLRLYTAKLEASNRELQDFAYIASHDLQEPLRKINAFADRIQKMNLSGLDERVYDYLARMQSAATRMQELIDDLLSLSRVATQGRPFVETDLNQVLTEVLSDLETSLEEAQAEVTWDNLPVIQADPVQMRQIFQNLIANSIKFRAEDRPPRIHLGAEAVSQEGEAQVRIWVEDNGIGFSPKYKEKIFEPFQRLHGRQVYSGTGMGLAIVRKIVERHHGSISAESEPGRGARFVITLPEAHLPADEQAVRPALTKEALR